MLEHTDLQIDLGNILGGIGDLEHVAPTLRWCDPEGVILFSGKTGRLPLDAIVYAGQIDGLRLTHVYIRCREAALHCNRSGSLVFHLGTSTWVDRSRFGTGFCMQAGLIGIGNADARSSNLDANCQDIHGIRLPRAKCMAERAGINRSTQALAPIRRA